MNEGASGGRSGDLRGMIDLKNMKVAKQIS